MPETPPSPSDTPFATAPEPRLSGMAERPAGFGYAPHPDLATPRPADAQASTAQARGLVKVSMNFTPQTIDVLRKLADHQNRTMTEVVRRAIGLLDFIEKERKPAASC